MSRANWPVLVLLLSSCLVGVRAEQTQPLSYPTRPITFVAPFGVGASTDTLARLLADQLAKSMGQPVIVENRVGASGIVGTEVVLNAPADGYTVLVAGSAALVFNRLVFPKLPYDADDLVPVTVLAEYPLVIAANKDSPIKSFADMVKFAKEKPGQLTYSYTSATFQAQMEYLAALLKIKLSPIPYTGGGAALQAVVAGDTSLIAQDPTSIAPMHKSGKLRAIAVTSKKRNPALPDVPTVAELGMPNFETGVFMGLAVPRKTPPAIVHKLYREIAKALAVPAIRDRIVQLGMEPVGLSPEESTAMVKREVAQYQPIIEAAGMRFEK